MRKLQREAQHPFPETPPYRDATRRRLIHYHPYEMRRRLGWVLLLEECNTFCKLLLICQPIEPTDTEFHHLLLLLHCLLLCFLDSYFA
jgi:hypothetical protein